MVSKRFNLGNVIEESSKEVLEVFEKEILKVNDKTDREKLSKLFSFACKNPSLFTNINVQDNKDVCVQETEYIKKWISNYIKGRENIKSQVPLKNYGEKDSALIARVQSSTEADEELMKSYIDGHFLFMSAENMNGSILEEYLAYVLEPENWIWCVGSVYRAVDFCYLEGDTPKLLQVKNKYNTENSSSSAIREGTAIEKWNRLDRPKAPDKYKPIPNWKKLRDIVDIPSLNDRLTEEAYLQYIKENSTKKLDTL